MTIQERQAARLLEIEQRLPQIDPEVRRGGAGLQACEAAIAEADALLAEAKGLARDGHTMALARIAISAGWLLGRLERARCQARRAARQA